VDREILLWINRHSAPWLDQLFFRSHLMGTLPFCAALVVATAGWHLRRHEQRPALLWVVLGLSTYALQVGLKATVDRARPELWDRLVLTGSSSFPSGHAMAGATFYPLLAWSFSRFAPRWRVLWWVLGLALGFFVGFGRLYLGVHWPSDVLAGWAIGAGQTIMGLTWLTRRERMTKGPQPASGAEAGEVST
jgi:undecaprenyl-diphosphatase